MQEKKETIREYYNADPKKEWDRLQKEHPFEKYITINMMERYIKPGSRILDVGGGPGHYSIHFAGKDHDVTLVDLSDENVRFAKRKARQYKVHFNAMQGDALDLSSFADNSFDVVFLMGPLYHLMKEDSRRKAVSEAMRVLKPGGYLFSSFILMFGGVIFGLRELQESILREKEKPLFDIASDDGSVAFEAFTYAYMTTVKDAKTFMDSISGLKTKTMFGQESILAPYKYQLMESTKKIRDAWYEYGIKFCEKEDYLTHSEHLMFVSVKDL